MEMVANIDWWRTFAKFFSCSWFLEVLGLSLIRLFEILIFFWYLPLSSLGYLVASGGHGVLVLGCFYLLLFQLVFLMWWFRFLLWMQFLVHPRYPSFWENPLLPYSMVEWDWWMGMFRNNLSWIYPPPSNSGKWRFIRIPEPRNVMSSWWWVGGRSKIYLPTLKHWKAHGFREITPQRDLLREWVWLLIWWLLLDLLCWRVRGLSASKGSG